MAFFYLMFTLCAIRFVWDMGSKLDYTLYLGPPTISFILLYLLLTKTV
jgi:hypothetical protein